MTYIVDIDDTLILYPDTWKGPEERGGRERYIYATPNYREIKLVNEAYQNHTIIIFTGRNWDQYETTKAQLKKFGVKYHQLIMGKPQGIFIDSDNKKSISEEE